VNELLTYNVRLTHSSVRTICDNADRIKDNVCILYRNYIYCICTVHIAHLQQKCHNSKFGIFELLEEKETFADALLTGIVSQHSL